MDNRIMGTGESLIEISGNHIGYITKLEVESKSYLTIDHSILSKNIVKLDFKLPNSCSQYNEIFNRGLIVSFVRLYNEKFDTNSIKSDTVLGGIIDAYIKFRNMCKTEEKFNLKINVKLEDEVMNAYNTIYSAIRKPLYTNILLEDYNENNA